MRIENLREATPREIDTELARLYEMRGDAWQKLCGLRKRLDGWIRVDAGSPDQRADMESAIQEAQAHFDRLVGLCKPYSDEFVRRSGWTRAFQVTNADGHIHRGMACSTCRRSTGFDWLPDVSGMPENEIVALAGERACTVCYPSAPVDLKRACRLEGKTHRKIRQEREAKQAEKARRDAEKEAKAIYNPDGSPLYEADDLAKMGQDGTYRNGNKLQTVVAAQRALSGAAHSIKWYRMIDGNAHPFEGSWMETVRRCATALAHKLGEDEQALIDAAMNKAEKKARREMG